MATYDINFTNVSKPPVEVPENVIDDSLAVKLFGRKKLAYGQDLNENFLHFLESFACPRDGNSTTPIPDKSQASGTMFDNPIEGQLWYDTTPSSEGLYVYDGSNWNSLYKFGEIAANWGVIAHGGQIPLPVSPDGKTYTYAECSWIVTPYGYPNAIDFMSCSTDANAVVTMQYSLENDATLVPGYANFIIVGIPGNVNLGSLLA